MPYQSLVASWDREMFQGFTVAINLAMLAGPTSPKKSSYPVPIKESNWFVIVLQIIISTSRTGMRYCEHLSCRNSIFISSDRFLVAIRPLSVPFSNSYLRKMKVNLTAKQARLGDEHSIGFNGNYVVFDEYGYWKSQRIFRIYSPYNWDLPQRFYLALIEISW